MTYIKARFALAERGLTAIHGVFINRVAGMVEYILHHWELLLRDMELGTVSVRLPEAQRSLLLRRLPPDPRRVRELQNIPREGLSRGIVPKIWPNMRYILAIGGQASKVICLDETGAVTNFIMNDKYAAGTGRFLEMMARTLELDMDQMSQQGLTWKKDLTSSSMCTVFAESEVISLIADNHSDNDIIHGLNKSIAAKTASMVSRAKGRGPYMMTGGVARNKGWSRRWKPVWGRACISQRPLTCAVRLAPRCSRWRSPAEKQELV